MITIANIASCVLKTLDRVLNKLSIEKEAVNQTNGMKIANRTKQVCDVIYVRRNTLYIANTEEDHAKRVIERMSQLGYTLITKPKKVNDIASKISFIKYITPYIEDNENTADQLLRYTTCTSITFTYQYGGETFQEGWKYPISKSFRGDIFDFFFR